MLLAVLYCFAVPNKYSVLTCFQRFCCWIDILNPFYVFTSKKKIDNARMLLLDARKNNTDSLQDEKMKKAWMLSVASVNPISGEIMPAIFRPPAFTLCTFPLVITSTLMNRNVLHTFLSQTAFHAYVNGFGLENGNCRIRTNEAGTEDVKLFVQNIFPVFVAVTYSSLMGTLPHFFINRYKPQRPSVQFLFRNLIPGPLTATVCALSLCVVRNREAEEGIQVMDSKGNVVGVSKKAGEKAVNETALSRAALFGTVLFVPDLTLHFLKRRSILLQNPFSFTLIRWATIVVVLATMIPVSFSWMPQLNKIKRNELEPEIVSSTEESELFYYRGI
uniref:Sideroflexin-4 isoform X2 n=1 Tax=Pogona vitticeps TaxID=103695 RepID=A0A6J0T0I0_9SAUR